MSKTILIVEDNEMNMKLFHDLLKLNGHNILQAKDGVEALEIARDRRPSLILMDIQLPGMSGLEITKLMKTDNDLKTIPVVAITALAMAGDTRNTLAPCGTRVQRKQGKRNDCMTIATRGARPVRWALDKRGSDLPFHKYDLPSTIYPIRSTQYDASSLYFSQHT